MKLLLFLLALISLSGAEPTIEECQAFIQLDSRRKCIVDTDGSLITFYDWNGYRIVSATSQPLPYRLILVKETPDQSAKKRLLESLNWQKELKSEAILTPINTLEIGNKVGVLYEMDNIHSMESLFEKNTNKDNLKLMAKYAKAIADGLKKVEFNEYLLPTLRQDLIVINYLAERSDQTWAAAIISLEEVVKPGHRIEEEGDYRYWDPRRFDSATKPVSYQLCDDSYALGVIIYQLFHEGSFPYQGNTKEEYGTNAKEGKFKIKAKVPTDIAYLIYQLLLSDRDKRASIEAAQIILGQQDLVKNSKSLQNDLEIDTKSPLLVDIRPGLSEIAIKLIEAGGHKNSELKYTGFVTFLDWLKNHFTLIIAGAILLAVGIALVFCLWMKKAEDKRAEEKPLDEPTKVDQTLQEA